MSGTGRGVNGAVAAKSPGDALEMVVEAVKGLQEKQGSSAPAVKKYLGQKYGFDDKEVTAFVSKALREAVQAGILVNANRRYSLAKKTAKPVNKSGKAPPPKTSRAGKNKEPPVPEASQVEAAAASGPSKDMNGDSSKSSSANKEPAEVHETKVPKRKGKAEDLPAGQKSEDAVVSGLGDNKKIKGTKEDNLDYGAKEMPANEATALPANELQRGRGGRKGQTGAKPDQEKTAAKGDAGINGEAPKDEVRARKGTQGKATDVDQKGEGAAEGSSSDEKEIKEPKEDVNPVQEEASAPASEQMASPTKEPPRGRGGRKGHAGAKRDEEKAAEKDDVGLNGVGPSSGAGTNHVASGNQDEEIFGSEGEEEEMGSPLKRPGAIKGRKQPLKSGKAAGKKTTAKKVKSK